jgi:MoaA/NifB/PqqE/SkfB family radical SAM enzyme
MNDATMRALTWFRLRFAAMTKSISFSVSFLESIYDAYANHHKVIHWRDGCPVYSTFAAPALSAPQANQTAMKLMGVFQNRALPNMADIAVTGRCNSNCMHCSFKSMREDRKEMTLEQMRSAIRQCQELGVSVINFLGGEPLMREDITEIISSVNKKKSTTLLFTNGWLLAEKAEALKASGLDSVNVSLDSDDEAVHDRLRNTPGLYQRALDGIAAAKNAGLTVAISCCLTSDRVEDGTLVNIIELAKRLGVHEVIVFDAIPTGALAGRKDLMGERGWVEKILEIAEKYNKRYDYPGIYVYSHIKSFKSLGCSGGTSFFYITPYGDVCPCDFNPLIVGNILKTPLYLLWDRFSRDPRFASSSWTGCRLQDADYRKSVGMGYKTGAKCRRSA